MDVTGKSIFVAGANRGIGQALVTEALKRGAKRVDAAVRRDLQHSDPRVAAINMDVTNAAQIQQGAAKIGALDVLINSAGIALYDDLCNSDAIQQQFAVDLFGPLNVTRAFLPQLKQSKGAIVNNVSLGALAAIPIIPGYSLSKAAALNLTQSLRALLAHDGVSVHAVIIGPTDTDMNRGLNIPKASTETTAQGIFDGVEKDEEDIFPDPASASIADAWRHGAVKAMEKQFAGFVPASLTKVA